MADKVFLERFNKAANNANDLADIMRLLKVSQPPTLKIAEDLYNKCNGIAQSRRTRRGKMFEAVLEEMLKDRGIPFLKQVSHNADGIITASKRGTVHDIIVNAQLGDALSEKIIVSCKASLRERYKQDANLPCRKLFMVTLDKVPQAKNHKYAAMGVNIVCVGQDGSLDSMFEELEREVIVGALVNKLMLPWSNK